MIENMQKTTLKESDAQFLISFRNNFDYEHHKDAFLLRYNLYEEIHQRVNDLMEITGLSLDEFIDRYEIIVFGPKLFYGNYEITSDPECICADYE